MRRSDLRCNQASGEARDQRRDRSLGRPAVRELHRMEYFRDMALDISSIGVATWL